jgi:hypothetical protein
MPEIVSQKKIVVKEIYFRLLTGRYLAGRYTVGSSDSLQDLVNKVNDGTQSRVGVGVDSYILQQAVQCGGTVAVCVGDEAYYWGVTSAALGTEFNTSSYVYSYTNTTYRGANGLWASGRLASLITNSQALSLSAQFTGTSASAAVEGQAALLDALSAAFSGLFLTSANQNAQTQRTAIIANLGITAQNPLDDQTYRTGIYVNDQGMWTTSASLAASLDFEEIMFHVSATATTSSLAADEFGNRAWFASSAWGANVTSGVTRGAAGATTIGSHIYVSGNLWTNSAAIATALSFTQINFSYTKLTSATTGAGTANNATHWATMFTSGALTATSANFGAGIWISANAGLWTTDREIGEALGATQLTIALSANTSAKSAAAAVSVRLTDIVIDQMQTNWTVGNTGSFSVDLFHQGTAGVNWTISASIRDHFNLLPRWIILRI